MSKKSRKRNKKILAMLALAGGAAMMGRGKGTGKGFLKSGAAGGASLADLPDPAAVTGTKYPAANKVVAPVGTGSTFNTRFSKPAEETMSKGMRSQIMQAKANAPRGIIRPGNYTPITHGAAFGHRGVGFKKGGSVKKAKVTGIAKRGFGRALMKGKK